MTIYNGPMATLSYLEHPEDVLGQWLEWRQHGGVALAMVTSTEGGAVRAPGALLAVSENGDNAGYLSGGCIDADVALHAAKALETGQARQLRYGAGSPFKDLPLPCGGAIELAIFPNAPMDEVRHCHAELVARRPAELILQSEEVTARAEFRPKLRLRIAGRGADAIALAKLATSAGVGTELALRDEEDISIARAAGLQHVAKLQTQSDLPHPLDDARTAFVLMFHDGDWELPLLRQALSGPAFYVGAVGSAKTQSRRRVAMEAAGIPKSQIDRVRGPVGLVKSMRDASMLAVSTLAEIVEAYHATECEAFETTALIMLAAGQSARFEQGDKLLAELNGRAVLERSASLLAGERVARRIGVVGPDHQERAGVLANAGWSSVENKDAKDGQGTSLAAGIRSLTDAPGVDAALVLLADMPSVPEEHLRELRAQMAPGVQAVMSRINGVVGPPALFSRDVFEQLAELTGDQGARRVTEHLSNVRYVDLDPALGKDVDQVADIKILEGALHG